MYIPGGFSHVHNLFQGNVFVNGFPVEKNRNWYVSNTGYVLQLAAPYYEELTVRENLTLAAWVKLPFRSREKFQRVEQVMEVVRPLTGPLVRWSVELLSLSLSPDRLV